MAYTTVDNPELYFQTKLYTGNGGTQSITLDGSENMQPDWVFFKQRTGTPSSSGSQVYDVVRGATKYLSTHATNAEATQSNGLTSFDSDGFSIGNTTRINGNTESYVAWNWKAGGSASSNTDGSITSSVSANTTSGFSIVSYSGASSGGTIGHSLGVKPDIVLIKCRSATANWLFTTDIIDGSKDYLFLNQTNAKGDLTTALPTSSVFTVSGDDDQGENGKTYIAYCFNSVKGYSKFGSYAGNGNANGTFVYTGFKPAFVIVKVYAGGTGDWQMYDNKRVGYNDANYRLKPSSSSAEATDEPIDILSNGFKLRNTGGSFNASGDDYIYMAFAENPFVTSTGIPTTAR